MFYRQVREAEGGRLELQLLKDRYAVAMSNPESAWRFLEGLERQERPPAPSGQVKVTVKFAPFTPPVEGGGPA